MADSSSGEVWFQHGETREEAIAAVIAEVTGLGDQEP